MFFICEHHGPQDSANTSERFSRALDERSPIPAEWVSLVVVVRSGFADWHHVDADRVRAAGLDPARGPFVLHDRDRDALQLNDRLLIRKLLPTGPGPWRCVACVAQAIAPRDAPHLQAPVAKGGNGWVWRDGLAPGDVKDSPG